MRENIPPFFLIGHTFCWRFFSLLDLKYHFIDIDILISSYIWLIYNIDYLFSWEFFILGCFCDKWLVWFCANIIIEFYLSCISNSYIAINFSERLYIGICLKILIFIKPNEIELIENHSNQGNKNVDKLSSHKRDQNL